MSRQVRAEFDIRGVVQGVGFRYFVYRNAIALNLKGYVKNIYDGSVKAVVEGSEGAIEQLHLFLRQGPSRSYVESCKVDYSSVTGEFQGFDIR
ncbi:MAG: acylphosphatase [Bacteroidota bacterium]|nr:acylphosphatase [Bacteroidota bacterium]